MEKIIIKEVLSDYLNELIYKLYKKDYFGFIEDAESYVNSIYDFIYTIPTQKIKKTKKNRFGKYYCTYRANKKTSWFIVFDIQDNKYLINYITNTHTSNYPTYIMGY